MKKELNRQQQILAEITKELIISEEDLMGFGLNLGFMYGRILQTRTNHPRCVEGAALHLACMWWEGGMTTGDEKVAVLLEAVERIGKNRLATWVEEKLKKGIEDVAGGIDEKEGPTVNMLGGIDGEEGVNVNVSGWIDGEEGATVNVSGGIDGEEGATVNVFGKIEQVEDPSMNVVGYIEQKDGVSKNNIVMEPEISTFLNNLLFQVVVTGIGIFIFCLIHVVEELLLE